LTNRIYQVLPDEIDMFMFFSTERIEQLPELTPVNFTAGVHSSVRVDFTGGTGTPYDASSSYGSNGVLLGVNGLAIMKRGAVTNNAMHEVSHQWAARVDPGFGLSDGAHYGGRTSAASLVGGFLWSDIGGGSFNVNCDEGANGAHRAPPFDRYMAGFIDGDSVPTLRKYSDTVPPLSVCGEGEPATPELEVTISDIQAVQGVRTPGPGSAKKSFNVAFVAETNDRLLNATEMTFYEILAEHFAHPVPEGAPDPYLGFNWVSVSRFWGEGVTWNTGIKTNQVPVFLQDFNARWAETHVEVTWTLLDLGGEVTFEILRKENPTGRFLGIDEPEIAHVGGRFTFEDRVTEPGVTYTYRVLISEEGTPAASFETTVTTPSAGVVLNENHPNPFNPETTISFFLPRETWIDLSIFDVRGKLVRTLKSERFPGGIHEVTWDGRDSEGTGVGSGLYFCRMKAGKTILVKKMTLIR
jgi:hypothetical protein